MHRVAGGTRASSPTARCRRATLEHGDVERVDLDLHELFGARRRGNGLQPKGIIGRERRRLANQPLEGPVTTFLDARRNAGKGRDRPEGAAAARKLEGGDVVLDAVVVAGEGRRPQEVDRPVGADQPAAGEGRGDCQEDAEHGRRNSDPQPAHRPEVSHRIALPGLAGPGGPAVAGPDARPRDAVPRADGLSELALRSRRVHRK